MKASFLLLVCSAIGFGAAAQVNLQAKYPFSIVLFEEQGQYYGLHWNFTRSSENIYFAVNVSTTGWVGFGLSPNGQMPGSDVIIGWVSNSGQSFFDDRYAEGRFLPPVDTVSQDWFLTNSEEENGFTLLEFSRNFTSCDPQDLDITGSTSRVVWSFSTTDPPNPSGDGAMQHDYQGTRSINLIGGTPSVNAATLENENFLDFTVTNVTIPPVGTTYWCETFRTPLEFSERQHFINRYGPALTSHERAYVHHIIVYECPMPLAEEAIGLSMPCDDFSVAESCRSGASIGGWAVGGEDFYYPAGIAAPIGGAMQAMIEMHYDNPGLTEGVVDNSGMRFYYTTEEPEQRAGSIAFGHDVSPDMFVPPGARNYTIAGICTSKCTESLPEEGVRIFSNFFHTHLAGRGLTLEHYRYNTECDVWEELEPIDQNLRYDFNFQQSTILPREHILLPGDIVVLKCFYETTGRSEVTTGGESTREEMCVSFVQYYPLPLGANYLDGCVSTPNNVVAYNQFQRTLQGLDPEAAQQFDPDQALESLNRVDWASNPLLATSLQESVLNSTVFTGCIRTDGDLSFDLAEPIVAGCSYQAPSRCGGPAPLSCCERVAAAGAAHTKISVAMGSFMLLLVSSAL